MSDADRAARAIVHGRVVTAMAVLEDATVHLGEDGRIAGIGGAVPRGADVVDAAGAFVLPGLVDLHCDALEQEATPRPGGDLDPAIALAEMDRRAVTSGILTPLHAVAFLDGSPAGLAKAASLARAVLAPAVPLRVAHRLHVRCEVTQPHVAAAVLPLLGAGDAIPLVSLMDHAPGRGQFPRAADYLRFLERRGLGREPALANLQRTLPLAAPAVREQAAAIAAAADACGAVIALHDDDGSLAPLLPAAAAISEFPLTLAAADAARARGQAVVVGAPNVVRGRSSGGHLSAIEAVRAGLVTALCSDYHPPSLLHAVFRLAATGVCSLPRAVALATEGPAAAARLPLRPIVEEGAPGDLLLVDGAPSMPQLREALVGGRSVVRLAPGASR